MSWSGMGSGHSRRGNETEELYRAAARAWGGRGWSGWRTRRRNARLWSETVTKFFGSSAGGVAIRGFQFAIMARAIRKYSSWLSSGVGFDTTAKQAAEAVLEYSSRIVPYDTGVLERSGDVVAGQRWKNEWTVRYHAFYAWLQHENPYFQHAPGRRYKYLQEALIANAKHFDRNVKKTLEHGIAIHFPTGQVTGGLRDFDWAIVPPASGGGYVSLPIGHPGLPGYDGRDWRGR